jgi:rhamnulose-1-phosphate aldolase/alcohol dehydrogenase
MQNRWDDSKAAELDALGLVTYQSRLLGEDRDLVLWGGGNTSVKVTETDFRGRQTYVLRVKGSGSDLRTIVPSQFSGVRMEDILPLEERDAMTDEEMTAYLSHCLMDPAAPRPSIETLLHGFLPAVSVAHTHADAIVALCNHTRWQEAMSECYGDTVLLIDYIRPGFELSKRVSRAARARPDVQAAILLNHGLITWADTVKEAYDLHIAFVTRAEQYIESRAQCSWWAGVSVSSERDRPQRAAEIAPLIRGAAVRAAMAQAAAQTPTKHRVVCAWDDSPETLRLLAEPRLREIITRGPATPDHLLHTRRMPLWIDLPENGDAAEAVEAAARAWVCSYQAYFEKHRTDEQMLDPLPRVVLVPGVGMFNVGRDIKAARVARDIFQHTLRVIENATRLGDWQPIPDHESFLVEYWPMELYKLSLAPPERDLARRVALVTGATGAIGAAICRRFHAEGAHVVITDLDGDRASALAEEIAGNSGSAVGIAMDVTSESSVQTAFSEALRVFGGIDIVVSNAGIAHSARIADLELDDWQRSLDVNATGHFLTCREALRIFEKQGIGGSIVMNVTKNALAAGAEFGAYSASKAAELQLGRVMAIENGAGGVRVNMMNPDAIFSAGLWSQEMKQRRAEAQGIRVDEIEEHYRRRNLLQARVSAEDCAETALWLASDRSAKTTGCIIPVDGGIREAFPR